jgi:hypothetical protein
MLCCKLNIYVVLILFIIFILHLVFIFFSLWLHKYWKTFFICFTSLAYLDLQLFIKIFTMNIQSFFLNFIKPFNIYWTYYNSCFTASTHTTDVQVIFAERYVTFRTLTNHVIGYYDYCDISILNNSKLVTLTTICIVIKKVSPNLKEFDPVD